MGFFNAKSLGMAAHSPPGAAPRLSLELTPCCFPQRIVAAIYTLLRLPPEV